MYLVYILLVILSLYLWHIKTCKYRLMKNIPGPPSHILLGNIGLLKGNIEELFQSIVTLNKKFGNIVKIWTSPITAKVVIADPEVAQKVLNSSMSKSTLYKYMCPWMGKGLVTSPVDLWRKDRKLTNSVFNMKLMDTYNAAFEYHGNELVSVLKDKTGLKSINIVPFVDLYALDVACETMMGVRTHTLLTGDMDYLRSRSEYLTIVMNRTYSFYKKFDFLFNLTDEYRIRKRCVDTLKKFSVFLLNEYNKNNTQYRANDEKNMIEILLEAGYNGDRLIDHISTFVITCQDTPSTTIAYALYEIAHNPQIQHKVLEESINILGRDKHVTITRTDMNNMIYLDALIKESLRHYPPAPTIERTLSEDLKVKEGVVPAGADAMINIYGMHHDENYFKEPNKFDPDRFLPENASKMNMTAFMPFSKGSRDCIGKTFAMYQMKSIISKIVRNFELCPADPPVKLVLTSEFIMKSITGNYIQIRPRSL